MFCSFLNSEKFSTVKFSEKFQKNKNKNFHAGSDPEAPGADQGGPPVAQAASWRGLPPGRAHKVPGAHRAASQVSLLPPPSSLSKNTSSALCSCVLAALRPEFRSLSLRPII